MHGHVFNERDEFIRLGHEFGFAVYFYEYTDPVIVVIGTDKSGAGLTLTALFGLGQAFFAHSCQSFVKIPVCLYQSGLGVGNAYASQFA